MSTNSLHVTLEFGGGAELLFNKVKKHDVTLPDSKEPWTIKILLTWIKANLLKERPELFLQGDTVSIAFVGKDVWNNFSFDPKRRLWCQIWRPGILVLVNDADWELLTRPLVREGAPQKQDRKFQTATFQQEVISGRKSHKG